MKVLHIYRTFFPDTQGGLEEAIRQICQGTQACGVENHLLTLSPKPHQQTIQLDSIIIHQAQLSFEIASCGFSVRAVFELKKLMKEMDIIHFHFPWPFADMMYWLSSVNKPAIITYHSDIIRQRSLLSLYRPLMHHFLGKIDHIVATSPKYINSSKILKKYRSKVTAIPIGLNRKSYPEIDKQRLQKIKENVGENFFLFVGVLRYYKGLDVLLDAAKQLSLKIMIAGSGPLWEPIKKRIENENINNVKMLGHVSDEDKVCLYQLCRAVVFPSHIRSEAFGVTLVEGLMFGKPLISCEIGTGTSYVNLADKTGLVIPPDNPQALKQAITTLSEDDELVKKMSLNAEKRFQEVFTGQAMGRQYYELYTALISKKDGSEVGLLL